MVSTTVDHLPEYVIGFPIHVAITIRAPSDTSFAGLAFADIVDLRNCIGVDVADARTGSRVVRHEPSPSVDPDDGERGGRLDAGESRRMLTDVSPLFAGVGPGEYRVAFSFVTAKGPSSAQPVVLRLRGPTTAEGTRRAQLAPDRPQFANWDLWVTTRPASPVSADRIEPNDPLRFDLVLRRIFYGQEPPDRIDPGLLDVLTGIYAPEGLALRAELLHARGDLPAYEGLKRQILREHPGLGWWIRMIDGGGAFVATFRVDPEPSASGVR